jgi:D-erythrulose 1-phosphate 3-epimerase
MPTYPRLHLTIDNCFAKKRWTAPRDWMTLAQEAGISLIEASADLECDPLYVPPDVLADWREDVKRAAGETGARVATLYSGYGTYSTLGLAHPDARVRDHIEHNWLNVMIDSAAALDAGLGFYCYALDQAILADPNRYAAAMDDLTERLARLAQRAAEHGLESISVEQMYSPHQPPWTISGTRDLLRAVYARGGSPFYVTIDVGHAGGQRNFLGTGLNHGGTETTEGHGEKDFNAEAQKHRDAEAYMVADVEDTDPYAWLRALAAYSPVIHLQQTDGIHSAHAPFTAARNANGIITPARVVEAIKACYDTPHDETMPPRVEDIYLTFEFFPGTAQRYETILPEIAESAAYWREVVRVDGMRVDDIILGQSE